MSIPVYQNDVWPYELLSHPNVLQTKIDVRISIVIPCSPSLTNCLNLRHRPGDTNCDSGGCNGNESDTTVGYSAHRRQN